MTKVQVHQHLPSCFFEEHRNIVKKHHGAVDESSLEQQFHKLDIIAFVV